MQEKIFTRSELQQYDGDLNPPYIAYQGVVYDVSQSWRWRHGLHEGMHFPGQDLTSALEEAPHNDDVFTHPAIRRVGILAG
jgi:predicted heme/steroid binding protein